MSRVVSSHRQKGAVIITVALVLLFLLGFMGIALDFGHLFVVKTELQTAMDSCSLAAAQELDRQSDALGRATRAGKAAGNLNKVNFQGAAAAIVDEEITFSDALNGSYSHTFSPGPVPSTPNAPTPDRASCRGFCRHSRHSAATTPMPETGVSRRLPWRPARRRRLRVQFPVQLNPKTGTSGPNYGYTPGEWIPSLYDEGTGSTDIAPGHFGWANLLDPSVGPTQSAASTKSQLLGNGTCNLVLGKTVTPGAKSAAALQWNSRFGLYKHGGGAPSIDDAMPDLTGYSYTPTNWPSMASAASDFLSKRTTNRSYGDTVDTISAGNTITGLGISNSYKDADMGTYAAGSRALATKGGDRRLVLAPFVTSEKIVVFGCVLTSHPIDGTHVTVYLEYVGNASDPASPCASLGLAGGTGGPLVPVLVQ